MMLLVLSCVGCSTWPEQTAAPSMIGATSYEIMSCEELRAESKRLLTAAIDHPSRMSPQEQEQHEKSLVVIHRDMDALNNAWSAKRCAQ
jgi:hypothetical protein